MSETEKRKDFVTKGPIIDPDKEIYIERPEDAEVLECVSSGDYVTILGARQTGKTSLLYKLNRELKTEIPVYVSLAQFSGVEESDWYGRVARTVVRQLLNKIEKEEKLKKRFKEYSEKIRNKIGEESNCKDQHQFRELLLDIADVGAGTDRLVFLLNEVESVPESIRDDFFHAIRAFYDDRGIEMNLQKYIFVFASTTPPVELISRKEFSPFNVGETIYMSDFSLDGVSELGENLKLHGFTIDDLVVEYIYDRTHGHPNLTQEIFARLVEANPGKVTKEKVDDSVGKLITEGCNNLNYIQRRVQDESVNQRVLGILNGELDIPFSFSNLEVLKLYLIGAIGRGEKGECVIRNKVYEEALRFQKFIENQTDEQNEIITLVKKIESDSDIYVPWVAISRIDLEYMKIMRIKGEVDKLIGILDSKRPGMGHKVPSAPKELRYVALEKLMDLKVIKEYRGQYTLTEKGKQVIKEMQKST